MKRLILMFSLFALVDASADSCTAEEEVSVRYLMWNYSEYAIDLKFDEAIHGRNPDNIHLEPETAFTQAYGCSSPFGFYIYLKGYETRATLMASKDGSPFDLAYFHIHDPAFVSGIFSFQKYNTKTPECSCNVSVGDSWHFTTFYDCSSYSGPMRKRVEIRIGCT